MLDEEAGIKSDEIAEQVRTFVHEELCNESGTPTFSLDDDLLTTGRVDSLGVMRLIGFLESKYAMSIPMEDITIENFLNCDSIGAYLVANYAN